MSENNRESHQRARIQLKKYQVYFSIWSAGAIFMLHKIMIYPKSAWFFGMQPCKIMIFLEKDLNDITNGFLIYFVLVYNKRKLGLWKNKKYDLDYPWIPAWPTGDTQTQ